MLAVHSTLYRKRKQAKSQPASESASASASALTAEKSTQTSEEGRGSGKSLDKYQQTISELQAEIATLKLERADLLYAKKRMSFQDIEHDENMVYSLLHNYYKISMRNIF